MKSAGRQDKSIQIVLAAFALLAAVLCVLLYFHRIHLFCPIHKVLGVYCPGCGATRALLSLLHGRWMEALSYNPFFILSLPLLCYLLGVVYLQAFFLRGFGAKMPGRVFWIVYFTLMLIFTVLRNIPAFPFTWLAP